jgi:murein DD-endopeptidase MepM/ murein hydrolase activator NlpD
MAPRKKKRFVTIQILPEGSGEAWTFRLRRPLFEFLFYASVAALFAAGFAAVKLTQIQGKVLLADHMAMRNQELLDRQKKMEQLEVEIAAVAEKERAIRNILQAFIAPAPGGGRLGEAQGGLLVPGAGFLDPAWRDNLQSINRRLESRDASLSRERKPNIWPVKGIVTQRFSPGGSEPRHDGIDIMAEQNAVVVSAARGMVVSEGWDNDLGRYVRIDHDFDVETIYGHLSRAVVKTGDQVGKGDPIGVVGNSGRSLGPHLHFEIILRGKAVDPLTYLE